MIDLSIFIEASEEVMLQRRIDRDFIERGYDQEDVRYRFANHFLPSYRTYVLPIREKASIVIGNNGHFNETMDLLEKSIITKIDFLR